MYKEIVLIKRKGNASETKSVLDPKFEFLSWLDYTTRKFGKFKVGLKFEYRNRSFPHRTAEF